MRLLMWRCLQKMKKRMLLSRVRQVVRKVWDKILEWKVPWGRVVALLQVGIVVDSVTGNQISILRRKLYRKTPRWKVWKCPVFQLLRMVVFRDPKDLDRQKQGRKKESRKHEEENNPVIKLSQGRRKRVEKRRAINKKLR